MRCPACEAEIRSGVEPCANCGRTLQPDACLLHHDWATGRQETTLEHGHAYLERAAARNDVGLRVIALVYMAHAQIAQGRYADALATRAT